MYKNWLEERGEDFRSGIQIATLDPFQGQQERHRLASSKTPPACSMPFTSSSSLATPQVRYAAASSKTPWVTAGARGIPSIKSGFFCAPHTRRLTPRQKERLREAFVADEAHISIEVAYLHRASARGLPPRHTRPRPTPGRTPHRAPTSVSHPRNRPTRGEHYANGRTPSWLTSTPTEPATGQQKPSTESSNWADAPPEATPTPPTTDSECSSSQEA